MKICIDLKMLTEVINHEKMDTIITIQVKEHGKAEGSQRCQLPQTNVYIHELTLNRDDLVSYIQLDIY